jgi:hypothetical protein
MSAMHVVKMLYVEVIIKCLYRLIYMLVLKLINLVVFLKWEYVNSN